MDDQGRFNLDRQVALAMGYKVVYKVVINGKEYMGTFYWPPEYGNPMEPAKGATLLTRPPCFSLSSYDFKRVQTWIESQPGWEWTSSYTSGELKAGKLRVYAYSVIRPGNDGFLHWYDAVSESCIEEAGCMAMLSACNAGTLCADGDTKENTNEQAQ